jgi:gliding motility-associated-like protein
MIKRLITYIIATFLSAIYLNAQLSFSGNSLAVINEKPETSTGLNDLFVINSTNGVTAIYTSSSPIKWFKYSNLGGGYAEEINNVKVEGNTYSITLGNDDMGYIIESQSNRYYFWIVNYSNHYFRPNSLVLSSEQDCNSTELNFSGNANRITYYTINGQAKELSRELKIGYYTLEYNQTTEDYSQIYVEKEFSSISSALIVTAPLCNTEFTLSGDKFLNEWGLGESISSETYTTKSVEAETSATQEVTDNDNEQKDSDAALGGSAPAVITFKSANTDAVVFKEWQFSNSSEFDNIINRFNDQELVYTFNEYGTTYVRYVVANADGDCEYYGPTYEIYIGESKLECPNAFSPGASEGVNDEWKVSYKSLIHFECSIFNRWGKELYSSTNPAEGWDGKYSGKVVPAGVYFYVINAIGADGHKYKLSGDINIINFKQTSSSSTQE